MGTIAIRADGGSNIGMGHVMRTLVLAKELAKTNDLLYVCRYNINNRDTYKAGIDKILSEGFRVEYIGDNSMLEDLRNIKADCLITDSYDVDERYFSETRKIFNKTVYIDDLALYKFEVDIIINQNINACDLEYKTTGDTKLLLGTEYVMLRDEFRNLPRKKINEKVENILLTLGGADPDNLTVAILGSIKKLDYQFNIVVGPSFKNVDLLKQIENENENIKLYFNANMLNLMKQADLAISSCGSTLYELATCGVPTIGIVIADNQLGISKKMSVLNVIELIENFNIHNKDYFRKYVTELCSCYERRNVMCNNGQNLVDGNGVYRIASIINCLL